VSIASQTRLRRGTCRLCPSVAPFANAFYSTSSCARCDGKYSSRLNFAALNRPSLTMSLRRARNRHSARFGFRAGVLRARTEVQASAPLESDIPDARVIWETRVAVDLLPGFDLATLRRRVAILARQSNHHCSNGRAEEASRRSNESLPPESRSALNLATYIEIPSRLVRPKPLSSTVRNRSVRR